jgi:hypothetical protein
MDKWWRVPRRMGSAWPDRGNRRRAGPGRRSPARFLTDLAAISMREITLFREDSFHKKFMAMIRRLQDELGVPAHTPGSGGRKAACLGCRVRSIPFSAASTGSARRARTP